MRVITVRVYMDTIKITHIAIAINIPIQFSKLSETMKLIKQNAMMLYEPFTVPITVLSLLFLIK